MSFGSGMATGAQIAGRIPRPKFEAQRLPGAAPRVMAAQPARSQSRQSVGVPPLVERSDKIKREQNDAIAVRRNEEQAEQIQQIGKDYDLALASLSTGNTRIAEDFINKHGSSEVGGKITVADDGSVTMEPNYANSSYTIDGKQVGKNTNKSKTIKFPDIRTFYSSFFAAFRPKEGSSFSLPTPVKEEQEWGQIADGTRILNKPTGEVRETGYSKPATGSGSGKGTSGSPSAGPLMELADNYILNRVMDRMNQSVAQGGAELSPEAQQYMPEQEGDSFTKKIDFDRIKQFMTPEEVQAYNLATTTAQQMEAEGTPPHIIANKVAVSMRDMIEGIRPKTAQDKAALRQEIPVQQGERRLNPPTSAPPPDGQSDQDHPAAQLKPDQRGFKLLGDYLATLQDPKQKELELNRIADINPQLVIAYVEMMRKSGANVEVPNPDALMNVQRHRPANTQQQ